MLETNVDVFTSSAWMALKEKIDQRLQVAISKLTRAKDWDETLRLQGQIEALRSLAALNITNGEQ